MFRGSDMTVIKRFTYLCLCLTQTMTIPSGTILHFFGAIR
jgi:hypothetical protein